MTVVELNAAQWINAVDFYEGLLSALGAPEWHGRNINALIDSMIYGEINTVEQPFRVEVRGLKCAGPQAIAELHQAIGCWSRKALTTGSIRTVGPQ
ncbi:MAG: barstar family protein [Sphingomonadaceae bacterium]|nr:barstar family protein [Sphingomonadaceae bacterium]